ncbi:MAG: DUF2250 domain-containing protein [Eubacteriales bacterium]|nr:DUF2250 domain-containing protein [Bacillota bacterium]MBV1728563.1 DUF2250 domain-containing protein [Desulforudis sp.]MDP3051320.1 DUF2250 domain-containing protein [Eubacteriales bacterium]MDQ7789188.1 DUF2250 domain-containing protein [Clostridia bacterium]MBU4533738.1 DUF2250 domain-containing protein [Bacillota bacterium]
MPLFNARYYNDTEIWSIINGIVERRDQVRLLLAQPEVSTDPERMPELAREMHDLEEVCLPVDELNHYLEERRAIEALTRDDPEGGAALEALSEQSERQCGQAAERVYPLLLKKGYLSAECEDGTDLAILNFIGYAGPEYAWRLGINIGIRVEEARERLESLLRKGLLEHVQGTMLGNYHREKDWTKHMNHTYYRLSREGKLYLRRLRNNP